MPTIKTLLNLCLLAFATFALAACGDDDDGGTGPTTPDPDPEPENSIGIEMVRIEPGTFMMGDEREEDSRPIHQVTITKPFLIGKYEFLVSEYNNLPGVELEREIANIINTYPDRVRYPLHQISWNDAVNICNQLSEHEELTPAYTINGEEVVWNQNANGYRLPTEAEWEFACRAGTTTSTYLGDVPELNEPGQQTHPTVDAIAWYNSIPEFPQELQDVGQKQPNSHGLFDMLGNAVELVWDHFGPFNDQPVVDPTGPAEGSKRTARGGGIRNNIDEIRSGARRFATPTFSSFTYGFRVARNVN